MGSISIRTNTQTKEKQELLNIVFLSNRPRRVKARALAVYLNETGVSKEDTATILCICPKSVDKYVKNYAAEGIKSVTEENVYIPKSKLENYKEEIKKDFEERPVQTINEAVNRIENLTGIRRSPTQVREFIRKIGFRPLKVGQVPSKADPEKQKEYLETELEPKLEEAREGNRKVFFVDASHFVMGIFIGVLWCINRIFVKSSSGRQRFNVLGALDVFSQELITVVNDTYINSESVCELLRKIAIQYPEQLITIVMDNARYQRCKVVMELAQTLNIEILFLPPYSPNLNLIERLWKFTKKDCLYSHYYSTFEEFKFSIEQSLSEVNGKNKDAIKKLITTNFQMFDDIKDYFSAV